MERGAFIESTLAASERESQVSVSPSERFTLQRGLSPDLSRGSCERIDVTASRLGRSSHSLDVRMLARGAMTPGQANARNKQRRWQAN